VNAYAHAIHVVFLAAVPVACVAFVMALFLKEVPLRETARAGAADVGEGFGMPETADSANSLQVAISRVFQRKGREVIPIIWKESQTTLGVADGWCVGQVHLRARVLGSANLETISRRVRVPAAVLEPAFQASRDRGYLSGDDSHLELTEAGRVEVDKLSGATRDWLARELSDWGAADDELLNRALTSVANQFVDEDPDLYPTPAIGQAEEIGNRS